MRKRVIAAERRGLWPARTATFPFHALVWGVFGWAVVLVGGAATHAVESAPVNGEHAGAEAAEHGEAAPPDFPTFPEPEGARRLSPEHEVWVDAEAGTVIVDGQIALREGMLEMFSCIRNTKEHESIVSANTQAFIVHAALLSVGAEPGAPVQFVPEYKPPSGTQIEIAVQWLDEAGETHTARAQEWVQDVNTKQAMVYPFVFVGSRFWTDPETGKQYYQAEGGDFICVSNFTTAMIDIPVESSQANHELMFQAFTERIPPLGAPVRMILRPKLDESEEESTTEE